LLEHEVTFRRLDEKVTEHLIVIYQKLFSLYEKANSFVKIVERSDEPGKEEKLAMVVEANKEFWDYLLPNRVYVPPALYKRIREVADTLADIANDFSRGAHRESKGIANTDEDYWMKGIKEMNDKATPMFSALVDEIQRRLGVVE
jgi:hypothetical protein